MATPKHLPLLDQPAPHIITKEKEDWHPGAFPAGNFILTSQSSGTRVVKDMQVT
tara:strand:+ start:4197 stop:4358 length:162 start_codon:yes stop_codon:yes gene_type:complete